MDTSKLNETVRTEHEHQPSVEDQIRVIQVVARHGYAKSRPLTQSDIEEHAHQEEMQFDCASARPALDNLVQLDVLDRTLPGGNRTYVISERRDEIVNGEFESTLRTDREALIDHIQDDDPPKEADDTAVADGGVMVRGVVADALGVVPDGVEARLRAGQATDQREPLNTAIEAIESHEEVSTRETYGRILLRRSGYRYQFTDSAAAAIETEDDDADH